MDMFPTDDSSRQESENIDNKSSSGSDSPRYDHLIMYVLMFVGTFMK